ncbi:MAG TPA: carboxypeptidase-like regulatory domain-containing protein [Steroidobacteraceae bacterium]|nr:carboxypeptidase-like regulatory domain-containing protein [Steroidobacteraceae bacterium]
MILMLLPMDAVAQQEGDKPKKDEKDVTTLHIEVMSKNSHKRVKDAVVWVKSLDDGTDFSETISTDSQGTASLPGVPQGTVLVQITAKNWQPYSHKYKLTKMASKISIELEPETGQSPTPPGT